jgi:uncharacterized membrane protein YkvA (DUF1232 family)
VRLFSSIIDWITTPYTIYLILKDPAIPRSVKSRAIIGLSLIFLYIISPIDMVPDVVPFAGWLDDLLIIPLGLLIVRKITPGFKIVEKRNQAEKSVKRLLLWVTVGLIGLVLLWLTCLGLVIYFIVKWFMS